MEAKEWKDICPSLDEAGLDLLEQMLQYAHLKRISARDACNHRFFDDYEPSTERPRPTDRFGREAVRRDGRPRRGAGRGGEGRAGRNEGRRRGVSAVEAPGTKTTQDANGLDESVCPMM